MPSPSMIFVVHTEFAPTLVWFKSFKLHLILIEMFMILFHEDSISCEVYENFVLEITAYIYIVLTFSDAAYIQRYITRVVLKDNIALACMVPSM